MLVGRTEGGDLRAYSGASDEAVILAPGDISANEIYLAYEDTEELSQVETSRSWFSTVTKRFRTSIYSISRARICAEHPGARAASFHHGHL